MKVTVLPSVIGVLGTIPKGLVKGLEDLEIRRQVETIQTTVLLKLARILSRVQETLGDFTVAQSPDKGHQLTQM